MRGTDNTQQVREAAALWAARLEGGGMTDEHRSELSAWLNAAPEHLEELSRYRAVSAEISPKLPVIFESLDLRAPQSHTLRRRRWRTALVATGLAATLLAGAFWLAPKGEHYQTAAGERRTVRLADGSRITLNARTELRVRLQKNARTLQLERGEALFNVAKDPARPFTVRVGAGLVQVTGTVFDVRTSPAGAAEIAVLEGHVHLRPAENAAAARTLTRDEAGTLHADALAVRQLSPGGAEEAAAWREGRIVFDDTPLAEAAQRYADYHGLRIEVAADAADLRLGGRYDLENVDDFLRALPRVVPVVVTRTSREVRIRARPVAAPSQKKVAGE